MSVSRLRPEGAPQAPSLGAERLDLIARALALDPKILFYDEPSAGLDPISTTRIDELINNLKTTFRMSSVVVTHVMESVRRIADRIVLLHQGRVLVDGGIQDLLDCPDPRVQQFVQGDLEGLAENAQGLQSFYKDLLT